MKKDILINLISSQSDGSGKDETELITRGKYMKTADGYVISYDETEAAGFGDAVTKLQVCGNDKVIMTRSGNLPTNLVIENGKKHHCIYGTPFGEMTVGINTKEISSDVTNGKGHLEFKYVIDVNSSYVGDFKISIDITPAGKSSVESI